MEAIKLRRCDRCGFDYDEAAFYNRKGADRREGRAESRGAGILAPHRRTVCAGCEQTEADRRKLANRELVKANNALSTHAAKYGMDRAAFALRYGWDVRRMAYDLAHAHANTCTYCWQPYADMGNGLADVTLDIVDPAAEPYYRTNTRWCCRTCNAQKHRTSPELWSRRCGAWAEWRSNQGRAPDQPRLFSLPN